MNKGNLGIVRSAKGEERRVKNAALTTHTVCVEKRRAVKKDTVKSAMITTRTGRTK